MKQPSLISAPTRTLLLALCLGLPHPSAMAQTAPTKPAEATEAQGTPTLSSPRRVGLYVVRPGDTLRSISTRYSGGAELWQDNWRLNPQITDSNVIAPGQRLRILLAVEVPANTARITKVSRQVEEKPNPNPWVPSAVDHLLIEDDGLRTRQNSSSEILFPEEITLQVTENSLIFLERVEQHLTGVPREEIEIVEGQADLGARSRLARAPEIEIIFGDARARPRPGENGSLATRARKAETGEAQLMVYEGQSSLQAPSGRVEVPTGMGSTVPAGGAPSPPEMLLPAPALLSPAADSSWNRPDPPFRWEAVPGSVSYVLEICRDPVCGALERRVLGLAEPYFDPFPLPIGRYFWRATAIAASGLDGFPAPAAAFTIASDRLDRQAPVGSLRVEGRQIRFGQDLVVGPTARLIAEATDAEGDLAAWTYLLDGKEVTPESWRQGWPAGPHTAEARVTDEAGNTTHLGPLHFVSDPEPPRLSFKVGGEELVKGRGEPEWDLPPSSRREARREAREGLVLAWSSDGERWLALRRPGRPGGSSPGSEGQAGGDRPQIFFRAPAGNPFAVESPAQLGVAEILHLTAEDTGSGVDQIRFGIAPAAGSRRTPALWIRAVDLLGNVSTLEWPLAEEPSPPRR